MVGYFPGLFKVWYKWNLIIYVLLFSKLRKNFRIVMDINVENAINVHLEEIKLIRFKEV